MSQCVKCQNSAKMMCSKCFDPYCGILCQANDWYNHKKVCTPMPELLTIDELQNALEQTLKDETPPKAAAIIEKEVQKPIRQNPIKKVQPVEVEEEAPVKPSQNGEENNSPVSKSSIVSKLPKTMPKRPESPVKPMKKRYILSDLKTIPLKEGKNLPLLVLDTSLLDQDQFIIAAFDSENKAARLEFNTNLKKLSEVCKTMAKDNAGYSPHIDEICLAVFDEDGDWYRAVVLEVLAKGTKYGVQFIDYGNLAQVSTDKIMPITEELMFPTCTNFCQIKKVKAADLKKVKNYLENNSLIQCDVKYNTPDDIYEIVFNNIEAVLK